MGIPDHKKIVLYAGSIREWACIVELAHSAKQWPREYCFIVHGFARRPDDSYLNQIAELVDNNRVFLSTDVLSWDLLDQMLCSADIAIAAYDMIDENVRLISASSNKLVNYARCGLPLIITASTSVDSMFDTIRWGESFQKYEEIPSAISKIAGQYAAYRERSFQAFDSFYDLNTLGQKFANVLVQPTNGHGVGQ